MSGFIDFPRRRTQALSTTLLAALKRLPTLILPPVTLFSLYAGSLIGLSQVNRISPTMAEITAEAVRQVAPPSAPEEAEKLKRQSSTNAWHRTGTTVLGWYLKPAYRAAVFHQKKLSYVLGALEPADEMAMTMDGPLTVGRYVVVIPLYREYRGEAWFLGMLNSHAINRLLPITMFHEGCKCVFNGDVWFGGNDTDANATMHSQKSNFSVIFHISRVANNWSGTLVGQYGTLLSVKTVFGSRDDTSLLHPLGGR